MPKYLNLKYWAIFALIIWFPFQIFILKFDAAGISTMILTSLVLINESLRNNLFGNCRVKPIILWGAWILYNYINTLLKGSPHDSPLVFFFVIFYPFAALCITYILYVVKNANVLYNVLIFAFSTYLLFVFIFNKQLLLEDRMGSELNANVVGITSFILIFITLIKFTEGYLKTLPFFLITIFPFVIIILSESRKSFIALSILLLAFFLSKINGSVVKKFLIITFGLIIFYFGLNFVLSQTELGQRLSGISKETEDIEALQTGTFLDNFGDRGIYYYYGWEIFTENPLSGIGLKNFKDNSQFGLVLHTEYMVQLAETGIIGSLLFFLFYYWIGKNLIIIYRRQIQFRNVTIIYMAGFVGIIFINTSAWTYESIPIFIMLGIILGYLKKAEILNA